jgi:hypothetical protein
MPCPLCEKSFTGPECPACEPELLQKLATLQPGTFPGLVFPPQGLDPLKAAVLRRALLNENYVQAEAQWLVLLRGLRGGGAKERELHGNCWDAYAFLLEHLGRADEARRTHQRAASARKDPAELNRKSVGAGVAEARLGGSAGAMRKLHQDEYHQPDAAALQKVHADLDRELARQERREKLLKVGGLSLAGLAGGPVIGVPALMSSALGAGIGWAWSRLSV